MTAQAFMKRCRASASGPRNRLNQPRALSLRARISHSGDDGCDVVTRADHVGWLGRRRRCGRLDARFVAHGGRDPRVSVAEVESIFANLAGEKRLVLFSEAGHESYLAVDEAHWREAADAFLARVESGGK